MCDLFQPQDHQRNTKAKPMSCNNTSAYYRHFLAFNQVSCFLRESSNNGGGKGHLTCLAKSARKFMFLSRGEFLMLKGLLSSSRVIREGLSSPHMWHRKRPYRSCSESLAECNVLLRRGAEFCSTISCFWHDPQAVKPFSLLLRKKSKFLQALKVKP